MKVSYDEENDVLVLTTKQRGPVCATLSSATDDVAVELATEDGHDVVGLIAIGASAYFSPWKGYDADRDILTIGKTTDDPELITENGDFIAYWQASESYPDDPMNPIGVAIKQASKHLAPVIASLSM